MSGSRNHSTATGSAPQLRWPRNRLDRAKGTVLGNLDYSLAREIEGCESILDLGCGPESMIARFPALWRVGVELFEPYLSRSAAEGLHDAYIHADLRQLCFRPESFDAVVLLDVLEHLEREDGKRLLADAAAIARRKVIVFTPNGFLHQDAYHENPLQRHRSGWTAEDLAAAGFRVTGVHGWRLLRGERGLIRFRPRLLWKVAAGATQLVTRHMPEHAFHLFAVLEKEARTGDPGL